MYVGPHSRSMDSISSKKCATHSDDCNCELYNDLTKMEVVRLAKWLASDDTGASSTFLAGIILYNPTSKFGVNWPSDPSDFGRCYRMLECVELDTKQDALHRVASESIQWKALAKNWKELEGYHIESERLGRYGAGIEMYNLMRELIQNSYKP
jgi:hypothetical protein